MGQGEEGTAALWLHIMTPDPVEATQVPSWDRVG